VWIPLKALQSVAAWLVWKSAPAQHDLYLPLGLFGLHLFLGNWWNVVFFGQHKMRQSVKWMAAFWCSIAASIAAFSQVRRPRKVLAGRSWA
jgi:tryptophan-rich sensory protein